MTFYTIEMINDIKATILSKRLRTLEYGVKYFKAQKLSQYIIMQIKNLNKEINYIKFSLDRLAHKKYVNVPGVNLN
jgi:hypothetical protein